MEELLGTKLDHVVVDPLKQRAVTLGNGRSDGVEAASSTGITIRPSDIHPVLNYIGRSQFTADPFFRGYISDLRIYNHALSAEAVAQTMQALPSGIALPQAASKASPVYGVDGRRYEAPLRGLQIVEGKKLLRR